MDGDIGEGRGDSQRHGAARVGPRYALRQLLHQGSGKREAAQRQLGDREPTHPRSLDRERAGDAQRLHQSGGEESEPEQSLKAAVHCVSRCTPPRPIRACSASSRARSLQLSARTRAAPTRARAPRSRGVGPPAAPAPASREGEMAAPPRETPAARTPAPRDAAESRVPAPARSPPTPRAAGGNRGTRRTLPARAPGCARPPPYARAPP